MTLLESTARLGAPRGGKRRRRGPVLVLALVVALLAAAAWVVFWSPLLAVHEIRVLGVTTISPDAVRAAAAVRLGTPLARVSSAAVQDRVQTIPAVKSVEVRYGWPNELVLVITERTPVAVVRTGGQYRLVDASDVAYATVDGPPAGMPQLTGTGSGQGAALEVVAGLPEPLAARVAQVRGATIDDVELTMRDGTRVRWGGTGDAVRKAEILSALLRQHPRMIDVSSPDLPTTRGATAASTH